MATRDPSQSPNWQRPTPPVPIVRDAQIQTLATETFDILVIGGGATGSGIALDAALRGLKTALIERGDFGCETSSRSTKLIHGGVRYLERAVLHFDRGQFRLVREALRERALLLQIAPHLVHPLQLLTPLYNRMLIPYYRLGLRLYDRLSGQYQLKRSQYVGPKAALDLFPAVSTKGLKGGVTYWDGQFDDARLNLALIFSAIRAGATIANYVSAQHFLEEKKRACGVVARDEESQNEFPIRAKAIVNASGPFLDTLRKMEDPEAKKMLAVSSGTHVIVPRERTQTGVGLLIPKTRDNRVLFLLPWHQYSLLGTTDNKAKVVSNPQPTAHDCSYLLQEANHVLAKPLHAHDISSAWCEWPKK